MVCVFDQGLGLGSQWHGVPRKNLGMRFEISASVKLWEEATAVGVWSSSAEMGMWTDVGKVQAID